MARLMIETDLPKSYTPAEAEADVRAKWEQANPFHAEPDDPGEPYCILIPPPNVTAALHLGHALNNTLQDILIRYHRMRGCNTLWMPGTDHAGIATQTVVEKRLLQTEGKKRTEYDREEFIAKVQEWKDEYEATIIEQLKLMGCSCDFDRTRFTMDEICAKAVREAFFRLFKDGLIYRGKRLVNWDPVTQTALADDEVEMEEVDGHFWYLRYPLVHPPQNPDDPLDCEEVTWSELAARGYPGAEGHPDEKTAWVTVATTRPETYLGDTAVAVHPDDPRAKALRGLMAQLPLVGRVIPIIEDEYVVRPDPDSSDAKAQYATGFLKVTPAHDPNDWEIGERHDLKVINVLAPDATISDQHGWEDLGDAHLFVGKSREEARQLVVKEFEARGLLEATRPYRHSVGHSYRSHVPIEPYLSDQWYVRVTDDALKGEALRAMADVQYEGEKPAGSGRIGDDELRFFPERYAKMYQAWHENIRDWCISRQLWWGHRIPVWTIDVGQRYIALATGDLKKEALSPHEDVVKLLRKDIQTYLQTHGIDTEVVVSFKYGHEYFVCIQCAEADELMRVLAKNARNISRSSQATVKPRDEEDDRTPPRELQILNDLNVRTRLDMIQSLWLDPDVLDTWFSSALWPLSTMGWPDPDAYPETKGLLEKYNPSSVLCTARDIITLWVSRMVMFNRYFREGTLPFRDVYIHPMIQDGHGQRMSKSLGNGVDPRDIISTHGADALRFVLADIATTTQDVRLPVDLVCPHTGETFTPEMTKTPAGYIVPAPIQTCPSNPSKKMVTAYGVASGQAQPSDEMPLAVNASQKFDLGRNFCNKLWNATRFALSNLSASKARGFQFVGDDEMTLPDRWILTRLRSTLSDIERAVANYQFNVYAERLYDFIWRDFCDWYLEAIKPTVKESPAQQQVLRATLDAILRMLHPICPFVTEALWPHVQAAGEVNLPGIQLPPSELTATADWPRIDAGLVDENAAAEFERVKALVEAIRAIRGERNIPRRTRITLHTPDDVRGLIDRAAGVVQTLAGLERIEPDEPRPAGAVAMAFEGRPVFVSGLVDADDTSHLEAERKRLTKLIEEKERAITGFRNKLENPNYVNKAPAAVVQETRDKLAEAEADLAAAKQALASLESSAGRAG